LFPLPDDFAGDRLAAFACPKEKLLPQALTAINSGGNIRHIEAKHASGPQEASGDPGTLFTQLGNIAAGSASAHSAINKFPAPCQLWNWPWLHMQPREVAQPPDATPVAAAGREMTPADAQRDRTTKDYLTVQPSPPWQVTEASNTESN